MRYHLAAQELSKELYRLGEHFSRISTGGHTFPAMLSFRASPEPAPRMNFPFVMTALVAAACAMIIGWIQ